jgi:hypothetical protein
VGAATTAGPAAPTERTSQLSYAEV